MSELPQDPSIPRTSQESQEPQASSEANQPSWEKTAVLEDPSPPAPEAWDKTLVLEPDGDGSRLSLPFVALPFLIFNGAKGILPLLLFLLWTRGPQDLFLLGSATLFLVPAILGAVVRFFTFSYRLDDEDMVIREGLLTKQVRSVPYSRIQNVDLVQSLIHRWMGVAVVRLETASGGKPEAVIHVLTLQAIRDMRQAIASGKGKKAPAPESPGATEPASAVTDDPSEPAGRLLLRLKLRRLALLGLMSNRGLIVVAALFGLIQQVDFFNGSDFLDFDRYIPNVAELSDPERFEEKLTEMAEEAARRKGLVEPEGDGTAQTDGGDGGETGEDADLSERPAEPASDETTSDAEIDEGEGGDVSEEAEKGTEGDGDGDNESIESWLWDQLFGAVEKASADSWSPLRLAITVVLGLALLILVTRLLSAVWMMVTLYDFQLRRDDEDLRTEYGLWTKITATVPRKRIQLLSIRETFLQRKLGMTSVQIETAGGGGTENDPQQGPGSARLWLAPLIERSALEPLVEEVMPQPAFKTETEAGLQDLDWQPLAPGAHKRILRRNLLIVLLILVIALATFRVWGLLVLLLLPWVIRHAKLFIRRSGWALTEHAVLYRSGAWGLRTAVVPFSKIQGLRIAQSPFDRRHRMASLSVDTAGASLTKHRISVSYLDTEVVHRLVDHLEEETARLEFKW